MQFIVCLPEVLGFLYMSLSGPSSHSLAHLLMKQLGGWLTFGMVQFPTSEEDQHQCIENIKWHLKVGTCDTYPSAFLYSENRCSVLDILHCCVSFKSLLHSTSQDSSYKFPTVIHVIMYITITSSKHTLLPLC